jgi:diguanylate cyclase (GGDEF)-like protein
MLTFVVTVNIGVIAGCILANFSGVFALIVYDLISASWVAYSAFAAGETARERDRMLTRLSDANRELEAANRTISSFAYFDALTGLPSRKAFSEAIERDIAEARRNGHRYSVLMFDLDNFKNVNDSLGHQVGDELLAITGRRISGLLDRQSTVARLGGDEFAVLAPLDETHEPERLAAALIDAVTEPADIGGRRVVPGTSVGIAILPDHAESSTELLRNADAALRQAKEMGKGRVVVYSAALGRELEKAGLIAGELKKALDDGGLAVHYQPKIELLSGDVRGVEALLRWQHPSLGRIAPDYFLPIAAEHGLIQRLSSFVHERVAEDVLAWRQAEVAVGRVAVNIHPVDLKAPDHLMKILSSIADRYGVGPESLILEITEGCFAGRGTEDTPRILNEISQRGYELSLDDFGTGHAALTHLHTLPVTEIKIDRSFVGSMTASKSARAIVPAIIAIAKGMGLRVVAEGIETAEQLEMLRDLGADRGQGFFWSPALPADELAAFVCSRQLGAENDAPRRDEQAGSPRLRRAGNS